MREKWSFYVSVMIRTTGMQTFGWYLMISIMANHAPRRVGGPCIFSYLSCVQVLLYCVRRRAGPCSVHMLKWVWWVCFDLFPDWHVYDYLSSYPNPPAHTFLLALWFLNLLAVNICLGTFFFFNKPLIKHTQKHTKTQKYRCHFTHTHTHTHTLTWVFV